MTGRNGINAIIDSMGSAASSGTSAPRATPIHFNGKILSHSEVIPVRLQTMYRHLLMWLSTLSLLTSVVALSDLYEQGHRAECVKFLLHKLSRLYLEQYPVLAHLRDWMELCLQVAVQAVEPLLVDTSRGSMSSVTLGASSIFASSRQTSAQLYALAVDQSKRYDSATKMNQPIAAPIAEADPADDPVKSSPDSNALARRRMLEELRSEETKSLSSVPSQRKDAIQARDEVLNDPNATDLERRIAELISNGYETPVTRLYMNALAQALKTHPMVRTKAYDKLKKALYLGSMSKLCIPSILVPYLMTLALRPIKRYGEQTIQVNGISVQIATQFVTTVNQNKSLKNTEPINEALGKYAGRPSSGTITMGSLRDHTSFYDLAKSHLIDKSLPDLMKTESHRITVFCLINNLSATAMSNGLLDTRCFPNKTLVRYDEDIAYEPPQQTLNDLIDCDQRKIDVLRWEIDCLQRGLPIIELGNDPDDNDRLIQFWKDSLSDDTGSIAIMCAKRQDEIDALNAKIRHTREEFDRSRKEEQVYG